VLASACRPFIFQVVEIDDEAHWDSGYMNNPQIFPLIYGCNSRDVVIVHINPLRREKLPTTATEIMNRTNEISFNSSLMREMRAIAFVTKLIAQSPRYRPSCLLFVVHQENVRSGIDVQKCRLGIMRCAPVIAVSADH
jgi:NTE family protein